MTAQPQEQPVAAATEPTAEPPKEVPAKQDPPKAGNIEQPEQPKPTETVEFWKQKAREQETRAKANADAASKLKEIEDRDLSELEKAKRDAAVASERLAEYERTTLRQRVALDKGLPPTLVDRLLGTTEAELAADADELLRQLGKPPATPRPDPSQGARTPSASDQENAEYEQFYPTPK